MKQTFLLVCVLLCACGPGGRNGNNGDDGDDDGSTCPRCTDDKTGVIDCNGNVTSCAPELGCTGATGLENSTPQCLPACEAAEKNHSSVGCDYYAVDMDAAMGPPSDACFTAFIANTSQGQAHMNIEFNGAFIDLARFAKIPQGQGQNLTYGAYDPAVGLAPGQVAIVFLAYSPVLTLPPNVACPVPAAIGTEAQIPGNGIGKAFHITTDMPVVAYQMLPYGGGAAAATGASLLLPTSAWSNNYVAVTAYDVDNGAPPIPVPMGPSMNIVAMEDNTTITMRPKSNIAGGNGIPAGTANMPWQMMLNKGEHAQITQYAALSGSPINSDKPVGVFGGHQIMSIDRCCGDHGEQMIAPVRALGYEYVAAPHGDRKPVSEERIYRIIGAVDNTHLTYDPPNVGPATVNLGQMHEIRTATPFVVRSQGSTHPFLMFTYMSGAGEQGEGGWGDADFVRMVPPQQYMKHYVFFADPTYPFTGLTIVRKKKEGKFHDVKLQCIGTLTGWQPVGNGDYEVTTFKLVDHFAGQGACNNGVNVMDSEAGFGVWVWGWGSEDTNTGWVSYGYPAGEGVLPINDVIIL